MRSPSARHCLAALASAAIAAGTAGDAVAQDDAYLGLPEGEGREMVFAICGACHSVRLVLQQGLTREGWEELLDWMYEEQGMTRLDAAVEKQILDYLAEHVDPESQKQRLRERGILRR